MPSSERGRNQRFAVLLGVITVVALIGHIAYLLWMRDRLVSGDGLHYHLGALYLADGRGFVNPLSTALLGRPIQDAVHPPLWELVLALGSTVGMRSYLSHQLIASVVGAGTIVMTGVAGREAFGRRVGLIAAVVAALYANVWLYEREVLSEPVAMLGVATVIWLVYRFRRRPGTARAIAMGAGLGVLALSRSEMVMLGVILVAPLILTRPGVEWRRRILWLVAAGATCVVLIAPWAIYNSTRFEKPVPLSAGLGAAMRSGNCPPTYTGSLYGYAELGCVFVDQGISDDASVADGQYRTKALSFMGDHLTEVPGVVLARLGRTFGVFRPGQQAHLETERGSALWVIQLAMVQYWVLVPLGVFGAVVARRRRVPIYPLLVFPVAVVISVTPTIGAIRYRAPAEIPLVLLAAVGIDQLARMWQRHRAPAESRPVEIRHAAAVS